MKYDCLLFSFVLFIDSSLIIISSGSTSGHSLRKYCGFCHCGANSTLGQGDIWLFESTSGFNSCKKYLSQLREKYNLNESTCLNDDYYNFNNVACDSSTREFNDLLINKIKKIFEKYA